MEIYKTFLAKKYTLETKLGTAVSRDIQVRLLEPGVNRNSFDQTTHEHLLSSDGIEKLSRAAGEAFLKNNYNSVAKGDRVLTSDEVSGIRLVLGLNATELADAIGISKGSMSKVLRGTMTLKRPESILIMERLLQEITEPGRWNKRITKAPNKHRRKSDSLRDSAA